MWGRVSVVAAVICVSGCVSGSSDVPCDPVGVWSVEILTGEGDCLEPGRRFNETLHIEADGDRFAAFWEDGEVLEYVGFSDSRCSLDFNSLFYLPESAQTWEINGAAILYIEIDGDGFTGSQNFSANIYKDSGPVECEQKQSVNGELIARAN